jgi:hypothetical protein
MNQRLDRGNTLTVLHYTQTVTQRAPHVAAGSAANVIPRHRPRNPQIVQRVNGGHASSNSITRTPIPLAANPSFILRYDGLNGVSEFKVEKLDLSRDAHNRWDAILYRALPPSTYELLRDNFVVRFWRRQHWVHEIICWKADASAEAKLRAIVQRLKEGDILWIYSARGYAEKLQLVKRHR